MCENALSLPAQHCPTVQAPRGTVWDEWTGGSGKKSQTLDTHSSQSPNRPQSLLPAGRKEYNKSTNNEEELIIQNKELRNRSWGLCSSFHSAATTTDYLVLVSVHWLKLYWTLNKGVKSSLCSSFRVTQTHCRSLLQKENCNQHYHWSRKQPIPNRQV